MGNCLGSPQTSDSKKGVKVEVNKRPNASPSVSKKPSLPNSILCIELSDVNSRYKLKEELGRGLFGITRKAEKIETGELFACKSISKRRIKVDNYKSLRREVDILKHLSGHDCIASLVEVFEDQDAVHIILELCTGGMLYDSITAKARYTEAEAASIIRSILKIVQFLHSKGVMHRDLKLENFLWASSQPHAPLKAIDFGLSTFFKPGEKFSELVGSAYYVAPEVLKRSYGPEADVWSAGVIMYMLLCGVPPFWDVSEKGICEAVLKGEFDTESDPWPLISESAKDCLLHMLEQDTRARWMPEKLLEHEWVKEGGCAPDTVIACPIVERVKQFVEMKKIKRLALNVLVDMMDQSEHNVIRAKFDRLDANNDGFVTVEEVKVGLTALGLKDVVSEEEICTFVDAADMTQKGAMTFKEYASAIMVKHWDEDRMKKVFDHFDKAGKGFIEVNSLQEVLGVKEAPQLEELIREADRNGDGKIDFEEFKMMMEEGMDMTRGPMLITESWIKNEYPNACGANLREESAHPRMFPAPSPSLGETIIEEPDSSSKEETEVVQLYTVKTDETATVTA